MQEHEVRAAIDEAVAEQQRRSHAATDVIVRETVAAVLAEQQRLHNNHADVETLRTISLILTSFGIEEDDRVEIKKDFQHLRRWRVSYETVERAGWKAVVTVLVTGICGLIWLGLKSKLGFLGIGN